MAEQIQINTANNKSLGDLLKEIEQAVEQDRSALDFDHQSIRDLRWQFDQVSAKMNQAIYNEQQHKIHDTCLKTVSILIEILARS